MGKRQIRVLRKNVPDQLPHLQQQPLVQVILRSKAVYQGRIRRFNLDKLELMDRRSIRHVVPLEQIDEIIYDKEAAF
ncbi:hypothetical protein [Botryobacter ruber]|uniref:hypothetical protein n=1 Tax=Botryobacter ruber TaxID=2171629 RepID=UPI000E0CBEDB|nr:hypothetical protein [Botryobacter ruber]